MAHRRTFAAAVCAAAMVYAGAGPVAAAAGTPGLSIGDGTVSAGGAAITVPLRFTCPAGWDLGVGVTIDERVGADAARGRSVVGWTPCTGTVQEAAVYVQADGPEDGGRRPFRPGQAAAEADVWARRPTDGRPPALTPQPDTDRIAYQSAHRTIRLRTGAAPVPAAPDASAPSILDGAITARGAEITVPVRVTCPAGWRLSVQLEVLQAVNDDLAHGLSMLDGTCTGAAQRLEVVLSAYGGKGNRPFRPGSAAADARFLAERPVDPPPPPPCPADVVPAPVPCVPFVLVPDEPRTEADFHLNQRTHGTIALR